MELVTLKIDNQEVQIEKGKTILDAANQIGIKIPTLCYLKDLNAIGACRVCLVEVEGARTLNASCVTPASEGMVVHTNTPRVQRARRLNLELLLGDHNYNCPACVRNLNCELQDAAQSLGIREIRFERHPSKHGQDTSTPALVRDPEKCILCRRCVSVCDKIQTVEAIVPLERGMKTVIGPAFHDSMADSVCIQCGQCVLVCPTGALHEKENIDEVWEALGDPDKHVIVQTAPAIRVAISEEFGSEPGKVSTGKLVAALKRLGFDKVFDTDFTADLTIMEEGTEFLTRLKEGGTLPLLTSCSPGWINFIETFYPELLDNLSTCKSPQQMFGALAKTYYAEKAGIDPADIVSVSIMPCVAKKFEAQRPEMRDSGYQDVDYVLTTRELARLIKRSGISFDQLADEEYDDPLGISTGAGLIFGASGGVMEAALRTVYEIVTGETLENIDFTAVRGLIGVKEASVPVGDLEVKIAVANGLSNARFLMEKIKKGEADYHFVEIMGCPGGCIGGGGQPIPTTMEIREKRIAGIYEGDSAMSIRKSHENPAVQTLYQEFLGKPLGEKSHHLLHTHYTPQNKF
ncbi:NADH-dependent [FeFe] hydrogenase, group A6 [Dehalobacterium formicoaceticum]|uniref:NADH-dependent [FeFe] hydrogenase, group A6 n=1 Tax=Dehalobacterium formicoaceticum TaxID=51515 RepID=A0ABT1Y0D5_9FIRM|nr:NADH-dependent [FeFe] hydrogenase, group A6 [Dehalobacterium formicoaceticum]MCR6544332.1 NADH-dependent [FeFe] hydrogenase, group A6 [Dehalobacterium formicoaceticum]